MDWRRPSQHRVSGSRVWPLLGFTMTGAEAGEVVVRVQAGMLADLSYPRLFEVLLAHATMTEGPASLFANVPVH